MPLFSSVPDQQQHRRTRGCKREHGFHSELILGSLPLADACRAHCDGIRGVNLQQQRDNLCRRVTTHPSSQVHVVDSRQTDVDIKDILRRFVLLRHAFTEDVTRCYSRAAQSCLELALPVLI